MNRNRTRAIIVTAFALSLSACNLGDTEPLEKQVAELKSQVGDLESKVADLESKLDTVGTHLSDAESEVDALTDAFGELESSVDDLESRYRRIDLDDIRSPMSDIETAAMNIRTEIEDANEATGR